MLRVHTKVVNYEWLYRLKHVLINQYWVALDLNAYSASETLYAYGYDCDGKHTCDYPKRGTGI